MNRYVGTNLEQFTPAHLPPAREEGRKRVLFLSLESLGWSIVAKNLPHFTGHRDDIDAVHLIYKPTIPVRARVRGFQFGPISLVKPTNLAIAVAPDIRRWFKTAIDVSRFDAIHCTTQHIGLAAAELKHQHSFRLSMMLDVTDCLWQRYTEQPTLRTYTDTSLYEAADTIFPVSRWAATSLQQDYHVPVNKISVVPPPIPWPTSGFNRQQSEASQIPAARDLPKIIFIGNDFQRKGGNRLLSWHQEHWQHRAELHIVSSREKSRSGLNNVFWHGSVPHQKLLNELLPSMDIFMMPTTQDSLGFVYIESAMVGLPVIGSNTGGASDIIVHGKTGFCINPSDTQGFIHATERLINSYQLRQLMGKNAYNQATQQYSEEITQRELISRIISVAT